MGQVLCIRHPRKEGISAALTYLGRERPRPTRSMLDLALWGVDLALVASVAALAVWVLW